MILLPALIFVGVLGMIATWVVWVQPVFDQAWLDGLHQDTQRVFYPSLQLIPPPMSCHTVTTPKATVRFTIKDRSVSMEVLHLDERFIGKCDDEAFVASNRFRLYSTGSAFTTPMIWGNYDWRYSGQLGFGNPRSDRDLTSTPHSFDSNEDRDTWLQKAEAALREWAVEWDGFRETPKPKRYKVRLALHAGLTFGTLNDGTPDPTLFEEVKDEPKTCICHHGPAICLCCCPVHCHYYGSTPHEHSECRYNTHEGCKVPSCRGWVEVKTITVP